MMAEKDPYRVLGVGKDASDGEIKRAFRKKARRFHPDRNPDDAGAEAKFKEVQSAYDKIGTAESRREYDQQQQMANMFGGNHRGGSPFGGMGGGQGFEDILGQMFGGGMSGGPQFGGMRGNPGFQGGQRPRRQSRPKGSDINVGLDITIDEAETGGDFSFTFKRLKPNQMGTMEAKSVTLKTKLTPGVKHGSVKRLMRVLFGAACGLRQAVLAGGHHLVEDIGHAQPARRQARLHGVQYRLVHTRAQLLLCSAELWRDPLVFEGGAQLLVPQGAAR